MAEPMTEERWREIRDFQRHEYNRMVAEIDPPTWEYDAIQDLAAEAERVLAENDRLRAENERLTAAHRFLLASSYCRKEMGCLTAGFLDLGGHDRFCAVRIAWDALHPEPTS